MVSTANPSATIPPALALKSDEARLILEPHGLDVLDAAKTLHAALAILPDVRTVLDACHAYKANLDSAKASEKFGVAVDLFLAAKSETIRAETLRGYRQNLKNDLAVLRDVMLCDLTGEMLMDSVGERTPYTRQAVLTTASALVNWCSKPPRRWCDAKAILDAVQKPAIALDDDVDVLAPEACRALLHAAEDAGPGVAVGFAVGLFAGVRMRELTRLRWRNVTPDLIVIDANQAKRGRRRAIPIFQALAAFLERYRPADADPDDFLVGPNWVNRERLARRLAGWKVECGMLPDGAPAPHRGAWPKNVCRHTCASLLVATGEPLEKLIFAFGHSGGHNLLRRHYVGRMTSAEAAEILAIRPK